jgi:hypothetical protein
VQSTRTEDDPKEGTADGLGRDADYVGVPKDGEYQLNSGEYLLINYTDSKTDESGVEKKTVINKDYKAGDIIRANFNLIDSALYHNNHSYSKKDGFYFSGYGEIEGMFTLGTNEQIEIREAVQVNLDEDTMYLYWELNSDDPEKESNVFNFPETYNGKQAYTLKEGEHLYYTNGKKQDLVYYGAGTIIVKNVDTPELVKYTSLGEVSEEDIMTNGLAAAIPWQPYSLGSVSKRLEIIENQYISLTEGDVLISVEGTDPTDAISNDWCEVSTAKYRFAEDEVESTLPAIVVSSTKWSMRSRLDFNMSKTTAQPLNCGDKLTVNFDTGSPVVLEANKVDGVTLPMYINSNYTCQAAMDTLQISNTLKDSLNLKLKISSKQTPQVTAQENLALNNYINGEAKYTKFNFMSLPKESDRFAFALNTHIPQNTFGLLLAYYIKGVDEADDGGAYLIAKASGATCDKLTQFNTAETETLSSRINLKEGLNVIKVAQGVDQLEVYADDQKKSTLIFGNLDLIKGINKKLDYKAVDTDYDELEQLLADIRNLGSVTNDFYYNIPIQYAAEIDLNPAVTTDTLASPLTWYDPNNVNRNFVISEIDADYLPTGITITKSSRV